MCFRTQILYFILINFIMCFDDLMYVCLHISVFVILIQHIAFLPAYLTHCLLLHKFNSYILLFILHIVYFFISLIRRTRYRSCSRARNSDFIMLSLPLTHKLHMYTYFAISYVLFIAKVISRNFFENVGIMSN